MNTKIQLDKEAKTLLIPLYGRAMMSRENKIIKDRLAEDAVKKLDFDFNTLKISKKTQIFMSIRGAILDNYTKSFLDKNPGATVIYLGCGLDSRFFRVDNQKVRWYDLDFPEVVELKQKLYGQNSRYTLIASSVTDHGWVNQISRGDMGKPTLIIAEGLLMYLNEAEVKALFTMLRNTFSPAMFIFDAYSKTTAKYAKNMVSLKNTGAGIRWGVDRPQEIETYGDGITYEKTGYLTDFDMMDLGFYYRFMFCTAGRLKAAKEAHRIFVFHMTNE